jgi:two-component system, sporulation sensor kinase B
VLIETLLLNFLFLLFPVLICLIFFENRLYGFYKVNNKYLFVLLSAISMVLCMQMPIKLEVGFIFDLRYIPFLIVALYGGYIVSLPLYLVLNVYRFIIGGNGIFLSLMFSTIIFVLVPLLRTTFLKLNPRNRIICAALVSFLTMLLYLFCLSFSFEELNRGFWIFTLHAFITYIVVMIIIMVLIEQIISNMRARDSFLQSERLNLISELSASVSHEIRNPLTVTNGFLQLLNSSETITIEEKNI